MNVVLIALVAISESVGVGLLGVVVLRLLRPYPVGCSLIAIVGITVCAMNTSTVTTVLVARSVQVSLAAHVAINLMAGAVAVLIGLLLVRSVLAGRGNPAAAPRTPDEPRSDEDQEHRAPDVGTARELTAVGDELAASRRCERAEASRRRLASWVSHDLRGPVRRIQDRIESIEDGSVHELPAACERIRADTELFLDMLDDLLELARIQAGDRPLEPCEVALDDLISDEVAELDVLADENGVRLRAEVIEQVVVRVDGRSMTRVLHALLVNGIQCSPAGAVVSVGVRGDGGQAIVSVADECGGIPEEELGSVFEVGWRDTSLGLAVAQEVVQAHAGDISVCNILGGCRFEVRLPLP